MKKLIKVMSLVLCLSLLISCGTEKLSDKYNEEEIKGVSEQIINNLNHNNYEAVYDMSTDALKETISEGTLESIWTGISEQVGAFKKILNYEVREKDGNPVTAVKTEYLEKNVRFIFVFTEDLKLDAMDIN
ncbi:DUF3887 domain-containing protein [Clostridium sp. NSJ-145]|uniref:DUF3887 domain-containing protein n=1 Tax=Clostridium sp. NSJ-145 TaxID=2897777 RepID=UPI001E4823A2|nr:DUF3887 domain-containing protein [Clostridium sp. NSJ-145]MCD2503116.1 DUF3887 domain-containing protein [Clostridium sp. NSJ-145]MDU6341215.1 DUF3887 domain-containing protein [Clostridium sp.]